MEFINKGHLVKTLSLINSIKEFLDCSFLQTIGLILLKSISWSRIINSEELEKNYFRSSFKSLSIAESRI